MKREVKKKVEKSLKLEKQTRNPKERHHTESINEARSRYKFLNRWLVFFAASRVRKRNVPYISSRALNAFNFVEEFMKFLRDTSTS